MKRYVGFSTLVVLSVGLVFGQVGCQSGWKLSNPFASHPRASSAETPEELDALDDVDELTSPPENYTVGDASKSERSESLAQKGRYEVEDKASDVEKFESETREIAEKTDSYKTQDSYRVADYSQSYQTDSATTTETYATPAQSSPQSYAQTNQPSLQSYSPSPAEQPSQQVYARSDQQIQQPYSPTDQADSQSYAQPYVQANPTPAQPMGQTYAQTSDNSGFQSYSAPGVSVEVPSNDRFEIAQNAVPYNVDAAGASYDAGNEFPSPDSFPVAQNSSASPIGDFPNASFSAAPSSAQPVNVAMNSDSIVGAGSTSSNSQPTTYTTGATTDSDPYSDVYYAPQTASSGAGFAPGGSSGLY